MFLSNYEFERKSTKIMHEYDSENNRRNLYIVRKNVPWKEHRRWAESNMKGYCTLRRIFGLHNHNVFYSQLVFSVDLWRKKNIFWMILSYIFHLSIWKNCARRTIYFFFLIWQSKEVYYFQRNWNFLAKLMNVCKYIHNMANKAFPSGFKILH